MQSNDGSLLPEHPSGIETAGGSASQFNQWAPGLTERQSDAGPNSQNQSPSWDGGAESSTPDDGLYHPGQKTSGTQETKKSATDNGVSSSGSQGTNGWSQDSGQSQAGSGAWGTAGTESGGQWAHGTTSGSTGLNAGQASIEAKSPQTSTTTSSPQGTQATTTTQLAHSPTPDVSRQYEGQNTWGNGNGEQWSSGSSLSQGGAATPDDGLYHPEYSNTNSQGTQQWTPDDGLYHPGEWSPSSTTKPTSTTSLPESTATQSSPPLSSSSITSKPTATSNPSNSSTTSTNEATKLAVPISLGIAAAAMAGIILWWLYRKIQDAKAERKPMNTLEEGGCTQDPGPSSFKRRLATLCGYSLFKSATKPAPVAARSSLSVYESPAKQCDGYSDARETSSLDETSSRDLEKLQPPEYASSTEGLAPEGHRRGDISMPYTPQRAESCARPRTTTPTSLPGVPEEPEEAEEPSPQITPVDSKGAVEEVYTVELSFNPISAKHVELKQGQTAVILEKYGDGWALCYLPESKAEGLAPRACLSAKPVKRQVSSSSNPMQHPQYNVSQFSFSSQSTNLGLDGGQASR